MLNLCLLSGHRDDLTTGFLSAAKIEASWELKTKAEAPGEH